MNDRRDALWLLEGLASHAPQDRQAMLSAWVAAGRQGVPLQVASHVADTFWLCCCRYADGTAYNHDAETDDCCDCGMTRPEGITQ